MYETKERRLQSKRRRQRLLGELAEAKEGSLECECSQRCQRQQRLRIADNDHAREAVLERDHLSSWAERDDTCNR